MSWGLIFLVAGLLYATRALGPALMTGVEPTPRLRRFLDTLAISVIAAIVSTALIQAGLREITAAIASVIIMFLSRSAVWAMVAGTVIAGIWTNFVV